MAQHTSNRPSQGGNQGSRQSRSSTDFEREANRSYGSLSREGGQISDYRDQAAQYWEQGEGQLRELVRDREGAALLIAAAAGMGIGLMIGAAMARSHREELTWRDRLHAQGFGRRLMERIEGIIPDAVSEHFGR